MDLIQPTRRGFITAAIGLIAAPAIVRASSLMPIKAFNSGLQQFVVTSCTGRGNSLLSVEMISLEAVRLFENSNRFMQLMEEIRVGDVFTIQGVQWND